MKKISLHSGIEIFLDDRYGTFHCQIADKEFKETNLNIIRDRIDDALNILEPIRMSCIFYDGWGTKNIKTIHIVRKDNVDAFDKNGNRFGLKYLYEDCEENTKIVKKALDLDRKGWDIIARAGRTAKEMTRVKFVHLGETVQ